MVKMMMRCLMIAAALTGCVDTSLTAPFRAEVLVRTPEHRYVLQTVALPDLTGFAPLNDPIMRFSDHPNFDEGQIEELTPSVFAAPSDYAPRVRDVDGVAVARDLESLLTLSAYYAFKDEKLPIAAKTGSAENENPDAHAWFAGYGPADEPQVVVTVMIEGGKSGADQAAPLGRRAFEIVLGK